MCSIYRKEDQRTEREKAGKKVSVYQKVLVESNKQVRAGKMLSKEED